MSTVAPPTEAPAGDASGSLHGQHGGLWWQATDHGYRCRIDTGAGQAEIDCSLEGERARLSLTDASGVYLDDDNLEAAGQAMLEWLLTRHPELHRVVFEGAVPGARDRGTPDLLRSEFFQMPNRWYRGDNGGSFPLEWVDNADGVRHPKRPYLPAGELYRRRIPSLGMDLSLRRLDKDKDLDRLTRWMNDPRIAAFWEHAWPREEQAAYIDKVLADTHLQPVIASFDDKPFGYFEIYWAPEDRIGPYCNPGAFDRGMHLLVGEPEFLGSRFTRAWLEGICHFMFLDDDRTERLVGEPQADNEAMLKYIGHAPGWRKLKEFDFPHKRAALVECRRNDFFEEATFA